MRIRYELLTSKGIPEQSLNLTVSDVHRHGHWWEVNVMKRVSTIKSTIFTIRNNGKIFPRGIDVSVSVL